MKNDIRQLRWLAEIVYNDQGGSFVNWATNPQVINDLNILLNDINDAHQTSVTVPIGQLDQQTFCVSAPLVSNSNRHYCIDADREIRMTSNPCPDTTAPHICPP